LPDTDPRRSIHHSLSFSLIFGLWEIAEVKNVACALIVALGADRSENKMVSEKKITTVLSRYYLLEGSKYRLLLPKLRLHLVNAEVLDNQVQVCVQFGNLRYSIEPRSGEFGRNGKQNE
jgi:hypothetical protein